MSARSAMCRWTQRQHVLSRRMPVSLYPLALRQSERASSRNHDERSNAKDGGEGYDSRRYQGDARRPENAYESATKAANDLICPAHARIAVFRRMK